MTGAPAEQAPATRVILPFAIVTLIWGSTWMVIRGQLGIVDPAWSLCYRFLVGAGAMFAYGAIAGVPARIDRSGLAFAGFLGLFQFFLNFSFLYQAERFVTSGVVAMVFALLIVPNTLLGRIFLGLRISARFVAGSIVALAGMALLFAHEFAQAGGDRSRVAAGVGFTLLSVLTASFGNVMQASERGHTLPPATLMAWAMLLGSLMHALHALIVAGPPTIDVHPVYLGGILYLGLLDRPSPSRFTGSCSARSAPAGPLIRAC